MAEDYNKLKKAHDDLYDTLYNDKVGLSVATKMKNAREKYGVDSPEYISIKTFWDAQKKEYDDQTKRLDAIKVANTEKKKAKDYTDPKGSKVTQINTLDEQAAAAKEQGDTAAYTDAVNKANAIRQEIAAAGYTPPAIPPAILTPPAGAPAPISPAPAAKPTGTPASTSGAPVNTDKYKGYTANPDGTVTGADGKPVLFVEEKDANGNIVSTPYQTGAAARAALLKQYSTPEAIKGLQSQMLASGYITQADITSGQWAVKGLNDLLSAHTFKSVSDVQFNGVKEPVTLTSFLSLKKVGTGSGRSSVRVITTRGDAKKMLDEYLMGLTGGHATEEETDSFYNQLHAAEGKAVQTTVDGTTTGSVLSDADRLMLAAKVARNRLRNSDVNEILKSGTGSQVAIDIANLQKTAANYGVQMTAAEALERIAAGVGQKDYLEKQQERLKLVGKQMYPTLAAHIDAGGTVADIADQYAYAKVKKLGVAVPMSTTDKDVMDAVTKGMSVSDFNVMLQQKPEWRKTEEAHNLANDFTNTMLKTFGLVG